MKVASCHSSSKHQATTKHIKPFHVTLNTVS